MPVLMLAIAMLAEAPPVTGLRIYLARHGQTDWNAQKRLQGHTDVMLNELGKEQARALAERLKGIQLDAIYTSSLSRSRQTSEPLAGRAPITSLPYFDEQALGRFEGAYIDGRDQLLLSDWKKRSANPDDTLDGGESTNVHFKRVELGLERVRREHPTGTVLIIGHGGTNGQILRSLLGLTAAEADEIHQANDELYAIDLVPGAPPLVWKLIDRQRLSDL